MIDKLIGFSIRNKAIIIFFVLALIGWGVYSLNKLPIDALPDITNNQVQVHAIAPALSAQDVEQIITSPLEITMANIPGIIEVRSISRFGLSVITIVFKEGIDIYQARELVFQKIQEAQDQIPAGVAKIALAPISTGLGEIYQYVLKPQPGYEKKYSLTDLRTMQDWIVKRQLEGTPGVAEINSFGGFIKQYEVAVNPEKLRSQNVTIGEIFNALQQNNQNTGGAYIEKQHSAYFIRGVGLVKTLDDVGKIVIKNDNGIPVLIRDVAQVQFGHAIRYGAMTTSETGEAVGGVVLMLKGENSMQVITNVKNKIVEIQKALPKGIIIKPFIDRSNLINRAIHTVSRNLIEGGLIVIFILILFLGNFRAGIVVASVIPLSMLFALGMMNLFSVSANLMSLGAIDFGLIVDGAVIIVESIVFSIHHNSKLSKLNELSQIQMDEQVFQSAVRIRKSAAFGEIIILMVYIP
ncbi:efflux RND transporter permease subunit, partial [Hydrotalea sp.]